MTATTPFQQAGLELGELSRDFGRTFGSRNLPECNVHRAGMVRSAIRAYMRTGDARAALTAYSFTIDAR